LTPEDREAIGDCAAAIRESTAAIHALTARVAAAEAKLVAVQETLETLDIHVHQVLDNELRDVAHDAARAIETANNVARDHNMQQVERLEKQERRERVKTGGGGE
jgi:hypothetical protein